MAPERIKDFKDLKILFQATKPVSSSAVDEVEQAPVECCEEFNQEDDDFSDEEIRATLKQHDFWLGHSQLKGWVLLDRSHPEYNSHCRPFRLLDKPNHPVEKITRAEFGSEPCGPWKLNYWLNIETSDDLSRDLRRLFPVIKSYAEAAQARLQYQQLCEEVREADNSTRIGLLPHADYPEPTDPDYAKKLERAELQHYGERLEARMDWLRVCADGVLSGDSYFANRMGYENAEFLKSKGVKHLWHFTDRRSLPSIAADKGLITWWGASSLSRRDLYWVANSYSRVCDWTTRRERFARLSFIPNSRFLQKVIVGGNLVWLRFPVDVLLVGDIFFTHGNAASRYAFMMSRANDLFFVNWRNVLDHSAPYTDAKGPTSYPNCKHGSFDRHRFNDWNSEVLIKDFIPLNFCDGIFDATTGAPVMEFHETLPRVKARNG